MAVIPVEEVLRANYDKAKSSELDVPLTCDPENLEASKVVQREWISQLQQAVGPLACGMADCVSDKCTITIQWDDSRAEGGLAEQQLVTETML